MLIGISCGAVLLTLAFAAYRLKKEILHPAVVFPMVWGGTISSIQVAQSFGYFSLSEDVLLLFLVGNLCFVTGAFIPRKKTGGPEVLLISTLDLRKVMWFCVCLHLVFLPLSLSEIQRIAGNAGDLANMAYRLRATSSSGEETVGPFVGNYLIAGLFFAPLLLLGWLQEKVTLRAFVALSLPWVLLNIFIAGRGGLVSLIFSFFYLYISSGRKLGAPIFFIFLFTFSVTVIAGNLLVGKIDARYDDDVFAIIAQSAASFVDYFIQGPILFSQYFNHQTSIHPTWDALVFPCNILEKFKLCVLPSPHQEFLVFNDRAGLGNVYSVFFSIYPKYGLLGVIFLMLGYGYWSAYHHQRRHRKVLHALLASFLFSAMLLSVFSDSFGPSLYFFLKIYLITGVVSLAFKKS